MSKFKTKRVLVAVKPADRGLPLPVLHARYMAEHLDAEIALVSCVFDGQVAFALSSGNPNAFAAQAGMLEAEREELSVVARSLEDWGARVSTKVLWRTPALEGILDEVESWRADMLVVGVHQPRLAPHVFLTDMDWQLMRLCPCPLLLAADPEFDGYGAVLAAVDPLHRHAEPSGLDRSVLEHARELSRAFGSRLEAVNAYPDPADYQFASSVEVLPGVFYGTENMADLHRKAVTELVAEYGIDADRTHLRPGDPIDVIDEVVRERDVGLLVVGATKRSRMSQAILGSTGEAVAGAVGCDILLVKLDPERRS